MEQLLLAAPLWGLVFARVAGVALLVPPVGQRQVPVSLRVAVAAIIAVPLYCTLDGVGVTVADLPTYVLWVVRNLAVGLIIGGAVAAVLWAAQMAGTYLETAAGWQPSGTQEGSGGNLTYLLVVAVFVLVDGHHGVLLALSASLDAVSLGPETVGAVAEQALLLLPARMFLASLMIAAPALLAVLVALAILAVAERLSAELATAGVTGRLAPLVTMAAMIVALPAVAHVALWQLQQAMEHIAALLR